MTQRIGTAAVLALVGILVMACSPSAIDSFLPVPAGPLVKVTTRGGECVNGPCGSIIEIARDGTVTEVVPGSTDLGIVPANVLAALDTAIKAADFDTIRARPFTGDCPTAFDGQEVIYEFGAPGGTQRIASCETEIDSDSPVFAAVAAALRAVAAQPVS
jgi:hypothetical protein